MDAVEWMRQIASNYASVMLLIKMIAFLIGAGCIITAITLIAYVQVLGMQTQQQWHLGMLLLLMFVGSLFLSFGVLMQGTSDTVFGTDTEVLSLYTSQDNWSISESADSTSVLKQFVVLSSRLLGFMFGLWGLITILSSSMPNSQSSIKGGMVSIVVGVLFVDIISTLNLFGDLGNTYLK